MLKDVGETQSRSSCGICVSSTVVPTHKDALRCNMDLRIDLSGPGCMTEASTCKLREVLLVNPSSTVLKHCLGKSRLVATAVRD